jgi:phosphoribosylformylglycinamidine (FGAM) synthase-like amidotransferase family enzyme
MPIGWGASLTDRVHAYDEPIYCPVAHGEGHLVTADSIMLDALTYVNTDGTIVAYPLNPNGSQGGIAGLCNHAGNIFDFMPYPEDYVFFWQHPRRWRGERGMDGLRLFSNRVKYA